MYFQGQVIVLKHPVYEKILVQKLQETVRTIRINNPLVVRSLVCKNLHFFIAGISETDVLTFSTKNSL